MEENFVVAHLSATAYSAGACLSGHQSCVAATRNDAASRRCHVRAAALKAAQGPRWGAAQRSKAACAVAAVRVPPPLLLCATLIQPPAAVRRHASPHCLSRKPSPRRCAPSSRHCHTFSVSRSVAPSTPSSCCYPSCRHCLSMRADITHRVPLPPPRRFCRVDALSQAVPPISGGVATGVAPLPSFFR
jgi:hypothetical protein